MQDRNAAPLERRFELWSVLRLQVFRSAFPSPLDTLSAKSGARVHRKYTCQLAGFAVVSELPIKAADAGHPGMGRASSPPSKEIAGQFNSYIAVHGESSHRKRTT